MMHAVHGYFRFAHIEDLIGSEPAVYARLPTIHGDESRTQGLDRLELTGFLQVAQTLGVHHGAWPTCSASTPARLRSRGRYCTWSARATSRPPCC